MWAEVEAVHRGPVPSPCHRGRGGQLEGALLLSGLCTWSHRSRAVSARNVAGRVPSDMALGSKETRPGRESC